MRAAALLLLLPPCEATTPPPEPAPVVDTPAVWADAAQRWNVVARPERWVAVGYPRLRIADALVPVEVGEPGPGLAGWTDGSRIVVRDYADPVVALSVAMHETGHALTGRWDHVAGVGSVMSNDGPWITVLSEADVTWCREAGACP